METASDDQRLAELLQLVTGLMGQGITDQNELIRRAQAYQPVATLEEIARAQKIGQLKIEAYETVSALELANKIDVKGQSVSYPTPLHPHPHNVAAYLEATFFHDVDHFRNYKDRKTGFDKLDQLTGSLYPGLYVIGAISSLGKTTFIHQMSDQLAERGDHILFFSLEQNRLEMVSKSLSRLTAKQDIRTGLSAINIRSGATNSNLAAAIKSYAQYADRVNIIPCNFDTNINYILDYTRRYIETSRTSPVVIVDYLQIIPPTDPRQSDKEKVDQLVRGLKKLQSDFDLVVIVVSSINRANYLAPIDFESYKESGGIEYTADVVWGLELAIMSDDLFNRESRIKEKREAVKNAKSAIPRHINLVCLKNRYGVSTYECAFKYYPQFDLFIEDSNI